MSAENFFVLEAGFFCLCLGVCCVFCMVFSALFEPILWCVSTLLCVAFNVG